MTKPTQGQAQDVFRKLEPRLRTHPAFVGIEIAARKVGDVFTDEPCVRVLVNAPTATHETLGIATEIDGVSVEVVFRTLELH